MCIPWLWEILCEYPIRSATQALMHQCLLWRGVLNWAHLFLLVLGLLYFPLHLPHRSPLGLLSSPELPRFLQWRHSHTLAVSVSSINTWSFLHQLKVILLGPGVFPDSAGFRLAPRSTLLAGFHDEKGRTPRGKRASIRKRRLAPIDAHSWKWPPWRPGLPVFASATAWRRLRILDSVRVRRCGRPALLQVLGSSDLFGTLNQEYSLPVAMAIE